MKPIRAELSIIACILCLGHMAVYLGSYLPRLLGNASINSNVAVAFGVAVALFVLLALLGVTSLGIVKRAMSSRRWTRIQRFAYLFFALIFCHLALMLLPAALHGGVAAKNRFSCIRRCSEPTEYCVWAKLLRSAMKRRRRTRAQRQPSP